MIITAREARERLKKDNPGLEHIWFKDSRYEMLSAKDLKAIVSACSVKDEEFKPDIFDCDDFSFELRHRIRAFQRYLIKEYPSEKKRYTWLFYEITGVDNIIGVHDTNGAITHDEGIKYIEPQSDSITPRYNGSTFFIVG